MTDYRPSRSRPPPLQLNDGESALFQISRNRSLIVRFGCLTREMADGVIVPTNTEFIVSGAADAAIQTVENAMSAFVPKADAFELLFQFKIKNPPRRERGTIVIDTALRDPVGRLGEAKISRSLRSLNIDLAQGWDRIIAAFVRGQSRPPGFEDNLTESSIGNGVAASLRLAADHGLRTVAMTPCGTAFGNIAPERSARAMIPIISDFLQSSANTCLEKVSIVETCVGVFERFAQATRQLLGVERYKL